MPDFTKLWDSVYLFGPVPTDFTRSDVIFFWTAVIFVALAAAAKVFTVTRDLRQSPRRHLLNRFFHLLLTTGLLVLLWAGFRFETIPLLSTRIIALGLFVVGLVWFGFIAKFFFGDFRIRQKLWEDEAIKRKYLERK
ncbi:MAG: hypothetical protein A3J07_01475 [Candidatus Doudnabacteria bacterium RIFCSPLOWO2_02_FULL_49_13]|nr:MAG: hypothetical protein A3J07_01475 [Candidatus Doudnabacteria bacterium RIFCSPLOWO2_02_FULL_49_13]